MFDLALTAVHQQYALLEMRLAFVILPADIKYWIDQLILLVLSQLYIKEKTELLIVG